MFALSKMKFLVLVSFWMTWPSHALLAASAAAFRLEQDAEALAKQKVNSILSKYCGESCELISADAVVDESSVDAEDVGFESVVGESTGRLTVSELSLEIQVDDRVNAGDRERLGRLLTNALRSLAPSVRSNWNTVTIPQIGVSSDVEDRLEQQLHQKIATNVQNVLDAYCSSDCILSNILVDGRLISPDDSRGVSERELVRDRSSRGILKLDNVDVDISIDSKVDESNRKKIYGLLKARTKFAYPVNINLAAVDFPTATDSKKAEQQDPWGLDRLRQTLQIFRDLAGTKEIITSTSTQNNSSLEEKSTSNSNSERLESKESRESLSNKETLSATEKSANTELSKATEVSNSNNNSASKSEGSQTY